MAGAAFPENGPAADHALTLLVRQQPLVALANVVVTTLLCAGLIALGAHPWILAWPGVALLLNGLRWMLARRYLDRPAGTAGRPGRGAFIACSAASGVVWGVGLVAVTPVSDILAMSLATFCLAGMTAGSLSALSPVLPAFHAFVWPTVLLYAARLAVEGDEVRLLMAGILLFYAVSIWLVARNVNRHLTDVLTLRAANAGLIHDLRIERDRAEHANRVKSDFIARMSHELRTPLSSIIGFSDAIAGGRFRADGTAKYEDFAREIRASGDRLLQIIDDILALSRIEAGQHDDEQTIDVADATAFAVRLHQARAAEGGVSIEVEVPTTLPVLRGSVKGARQIMVNLLSNAIKFTPPGGTVRIDATVEPDGGLALRVADTGIGIPEDRITAMLEPFQQLETPSTRRYEGTGLGLAIVSSIMEQHDGTVSIRSAVDRGTTVVARFPATRVLPRSALAVR